MQEAKQVSKEETSMEARAELRQVRISPRKVGVVLDLIRNKPCDMAMAILKHTPKSASCLLYTSTLPTT